MVAENLSKWPILFRSRRVLPTIAYGDASHRIAAGLVPSCQYGDIFLANNGPPHLSI